MRSITKDYIEKFLRKHPEMAYLKENIEKALEILLESVKANKIMTVGNGGSAADAEHISGELLKSFMMKRTIPVQLRKAIRDAYGAEGERIVANLQVGIKCIPLVSFSSYMTAYLNDCDEQLVYAQLVNALGEKGDVLIAISTSGNSKNVVYAVQVAKVLGIKVLALTGETGGKLKEYADVLLNVPSKITYKIQEMHLPLYHLLCMCLESELFD